MNSSLHTGVLIKMIGCPVSRFKLTWSQGLVPLIRVRTVRRTCPVLCVRRAFRQLYPVTTGYLSLLIKLDTIKGGPSCCRNIMDHLTYLLKL